MKKLYRRVETIDKIVTTDQVEVTNETVARVGLTEDKAQQYQVQWFTSTDVELPESSAIYHFLETEFLALPEI